MKQGRPLRRTVPALIFVVGSLVIAGYLTVEYNRLTQQIMADGRQELQRFAALASGELESAFRRRDADQARGAIERLGGIAPLEQVLLVAADGRVLYSAKPGQRDMYLHDLLSDVEPATVAATLADEQIKLFSESSGLGEIGFFPIRVRGDLQTVFPERLGWLVMRNDLTYVASQRRFDLLYSTLPYVFSLVALCVALWWLFTHKLLHRIQQLGAATRAIAMGDFSATPDIGGSDELTELGAEFSEMARRLQENTTELAFLSGHDRLTGLLNRRGFDQKLEAYVREAEVLEQQFLLLYIDIDGFRVINDTQGHVAGDSLINQFGAHLEQIARRAHALARIGGDEFAVLLPYNPDEAAQAAAEAFHRQATTWCFRWQDHTYYLQLSIGAVIIDGTISAGEILSHADTACYAAKDGGRNRVQLWHEGERALLQHHGEMQWVSRIQSALEQDGFELFGQPIMSLRSGPQKLHFEILLRFVHAGKRAAPLEFLPAAERFQLSTQVDCWVVAHTFEMLGGLQQYLSNVGTCCINLSGVSLDKEELLLEIQRGFETYPQIKPHQICFEITETAAITNLHHAIRFIQELRRMKCLIALDDFGSGLSSFGYLKNLPVDIIKIDGMFVRDMLHSPLDRVITRSINDIAHEMGKRTVAEYAESPAIIEELRKMGIDYVQGYGVARPSPLQRLLRENARRVV